MSEENPRFGRRKFLKMTGLTAAALALASCSPKEPTPKPVSGKTEPTLEPTIAPTAKPTETKLPTPQPSPTPFPTEAPKPTPTEAPKPTPTEILREKWGKVWEIKEINEGTGTGGPESGLTKDEERFGNFIEQITKQLEAKGESLKQTELFVGSSPKPEIDAKGKPKLQSGELNEKNSILCAYIFGKTGKKEVYCATEGENGKEALVGKISDVFTPEEKIWGASCQEKVDGSVIVSCADGTTYETRKNFCGAGLTELISEKETMTGHLFTAVAFQQKELSPSTFFLSIKDEKKLPSLPSGKERIDMGKFIPVFDLVLARFNVWESSLEKDNPYVGNWDLEKGEWRGEQGYEGKEGYQKLFVEKTVLPEPTPILSPEEEQFYADITRVFATDKSPEVPLIIGELERAKTIDPKKSERASYQHYDCYTSAASFMIAIYYSSGDSPQTRNKEMLKLLAQVREMARQSSRFDEKDWVFEAVDSY